LDRPYRELQLLGTFLVLFLGGHGGMRISVAGEVYSSS